MVSYQLTKKNITLIITGILIIVSFLGQNLPKKYFPFSNPSLTITPTISSQLVKVTRVIDGDTIEIETGQKVRYIGVDTPELHDPKKPVQCFAQEAMEMNKQLVEGKMIRLEKDVSETDKYKRLLRYIFLTDQSSTNSGEIFVNKYLIDKGFAYAATFPPDVKYANIFADSQKVAMENQLGLWKSCPINQK